MKIKQGLLKLSKLFNIIESLNITKHLQIDWHDVFMLSVILLNVMAPFILPMPSLDSYSLYPKN
jgi:hypothetical protein